MISFRFLRSQGNRKGGGRRTDELKPSPFARLNDVLELVPAVFKIFRQSARITPNLAHDDSFEGCRSQCNANEDVASDVDVRESEGVGRRREVLQDLVRGAAVVEAQGQAFVHRALLQLGQKVVGFVVRLVVQRLECRPHELQEGEC